MKILIIEDDEITLQILSYILKKEKYETSILYNGKNVLNTIEEIKPDLLITDIFMPEVDGLEVIAIVKEEHPNLPIIAMSSNTINEHKMSFLPAAEAIGVDRVLSKPINKDELLNMITDLI